MRWSNGGPGGSRLCRQRDAGWRAAEWPGLTPGRRGRGSQRGSRPASLPGVDQLVLDQLGPLTEGLSAGSTLVGLHTGVDALVLDEDGALAEGLPTLMALVGPLAGVDYLMLNEV